MIPFPEPSSTVKKILLVEDNPLFSKLMSASLARAGYHCIPADSAASALDLLTRDEPHLILSDYDMPEMNGFDFRQKVLQNPRFCDIPFVFLTSFTDHSMILEGLNLNALDYINKETPLPVIISKLGNIIKSLENEHLKSIRELRVAADALNFKSIPLENPVIAGFRIKFWHKGYLGYPGGDFIDFIKIDERYCFAFLGDIMGKKWKAWFFTFGFLSYIRAAIRFCVLDNDFSLDVMVQKINKLVFLDESLQNILSSLSLLLIDSQTGMVSYTGAGDLPLISFRRADPVPATMISSGLLLGLLENGLYDQQVMSMHAGDQLIVFTDGMIDIPNEGAKKSDYPFFVEKIRPFLGKDNSFDLIQSHVLDSITDDNQLDDASLILIEKL